MNIAMFTFMGLTIISVVLLMILKNQYNLVRSEIKKMNDNNKKLESENNVFSEALVQLCDINMGNKEDEKVVIEKKAIIKVVKDKVGRKGWKDYNLLRYINSDFIKYIEHKDDSDIDIFTLDENNKVIDISNETIHSLLYAILAVVSGMNKSINEGKIIL